jgi:hypothetical protein
LGCTFTLSPIIPVKPEFSIVQKKIPDYNLLETKLHAYLKNYEETNVDRYASNVNFEEYNKNQALRWPQIKLERLKTQSLHFTQRLDQVMEKKETLEDSARKRNAFMLRKWDLLKAIK